MKSTWILGSTSSSSGDSNSSSDLFSLSELSILLYYLAKEIKGMLSCEVNAKCMRPLEIISHESPRSFPHTVWIPHLKRVMQRCTHTQLCRMWAVKTRWRLSPPPSSQSLSSSTLTGSECQIVDNDKNALSKERALGFQCCTGVITHKILPIVSIMNMKTIYMNSRRKFLLL